MVNKELQEVVSLTPFSKFDKNFSQTPQSEKPKSALANMKKQRKWVLAKTGEVFLTTPVVLKQLQEEAVARKAKKKGNVSKKTLLLTKD